MKKQSITLEKYQELLKLLEEAERRLMEYHKKRGRYWAGEFHYFFSVSNVPCSYNSSRSSIPCLFTGDNPKQRETPKSFRTEKNEQTVTVRHFTPKGCPNLTTKDSALCLANTENGFFFGKHKVGKCPHKCKGSSPSDGSNFDNG